VAALVTIIGGIAATLAGTNWSDRSNVNPLTTPGTANPVPVALLVVGIAAGASVGVLARTHSWLGAPNTQAQLPGQQQSSTPAGFGAMPGLFTSPIDRATCTRLRSVPDAQVGEELARVDDPNVRRFAAQVSDPIALRAAVEQLLCPYSRD
jgi:hypothetical protein